MIRIEKVSEKTFEKIVNMRLPEAQSKFVASNMFSLAEAWLCMDIARPFAVCEEDTVVGFLMMDWDEEERSAGIWRFMIAPEYQGKGYGRQALEEAIKLARESEIDFMYLHYVPSNTVARDLYYSLGFREEGEEENGEIIMTLPLTNTPKVGKILADMDDEEEFLEIYNGEHDILSINSQEKEEKKYTKEEIREAINNKQVICYSLMGDAIGFSINEDLFVSTEYKKYYEEIQKKFAEAK